MAFICTTSIRCRAWLSERWRSVSENRKNAISLLNITSRTFSCGLNAPSHRIFPRSSSNCRGRLAFLDHILWPANGDFGADGLHSAICEPVSGILRTSNRGDLTAHVRDDLVRCRRGARAQHHENFGSLPFFVRTPNDRHLQHRCRWRLPP
jgi:hypothetical protein